MNKLELHINTLKAAIKYYENRNMNTNKLRAELFLFEKGGLYEKGNKFRRVLNYVE